MKLFGSRAGGTRAAVLFWDCDFNFQRSQRSASTGMIPFLATVLLFVSVLAVVCDREEEEVGQNLGSVVGFYTNYHNKSCNFGTVFYDSVAYLCYFPFSALYFFVLMVNSLW